MNKYILFSLFIFLHIQSVAQTDTTRVLFIGNSFTYVYDVPTLVQGLADASGLPFKFVMHAPGGISVGDTIDGTNAHMYNPVVFDLIKSDNWDFVSLQDKQGRFMYGYGIFIDTAVSKVIAGHLKIRDSVKYYHPCAHMLWFAGWGPKNGYPGVCTTDTGMIDNIYYNYKCLRDTAGEIISPIGKAWERATNELPGVDLWGPDLTHQSLAGSYLTACVIFTTMFRFNIENLAFNGGLDSITARTYRHIAYQTVLDSIVPDNLYSNIPYIELYPTFISATAGYSYYKWYRNGVLIDSSSTDTLYIVPDSSYYVVATDSNSCSFRSVEKSAFPMHSANKVSLPGFKVYPIPAQDFIIVEMGEVKGCKLSITDLEGRKIIETKITGLLQKIDIKNLNVGIYMLNFITQNGVVHYKLIKN